MTKKVKDTPEQHSFHQHLKKPLCQREKRNEGNKKKTHKVPEPKQWLREG
jgi:hypothetical protein